MNQGQMLIGLPGKFAMEKLKNLKGHLPLFVLSILILMHLTPFLVGYRLTADDIWWHYYFMSGWDASWDFIKWQVTEQGRIGHFVSFPFSLLGAHYAENYAFRVFYTLLYFSNFLLIGFWASLLCANAYSKNIVLFIAVVLISLHPLDYYHLAPNAYPLWVSLPIFIILVSRIGLWYLRQGATAKTSAQEYFLLFLFFFGVMFGEYGFLFGASLVASEFLVRAARLSSHATTLWRASIQSLTHKYFLRDAIVLLIFLSLYFGFRLVFPSSYPGNKISSDLDLFLFAKTFVGHVYGGTSIASFVRHGTWILDHIRNLGVTDTASILFIFISTFHVSKHYLLRLILSNEYLVGNKVTIAASGLLIAFLITTPIALTDKYQSWCSDIHSCIYLDSRVSYLGAGLFCSALIFWILGRKPWLRLKIIAISLIIAGIGAVSYANNKRISLTMREHSSAWDRAKEVACVPNDDLPTLPFSNLVDPQKRLSYHPWFDAEGYWLKYLAEHKEYCDVPTSLDDLYTPLVISHTLKFSTGSEDLVFLMSGWSHAEPWGVWSDSQASAIFLPIATAQVQSIIIDFNTFISDSHPTQRVAISLNGVPVFSDKIDRRTGNSVELKIPEAARVASPENITVGFRFPDAISPIDLGINSDGRTLAFGLLAISFR